MAEAIAKRWLERNEMKCRISSAGAEAMSGRFAAKHARALCTPHLDDHVSKQVTADLLSVFDLVFTMMPGHFRGLLVQFPSHAHKVFPLALDGRPIDDPFGGDEAEYSRVYSILEEHVHRRMDEVFKGAR
jgi:protein-tyrosine-phosphatase